MWAPFLTALLFMSLVSGCGWIDAFNAERAGTLASEGREAAEKGRWEEAVSRYEKSLRWKEHPETFNLLAAAQTALGKSPEAVVSYERAIRAEAAMSGKLHPPPSLESHARLAEIHVREKRWEKAALHAAKGLRLGSTPELHLALGAAHEAAGKTDLAAERYAEGLKRHPGSARLKDSVEAFRTAAQGYGPGGAGGPATAAESGGGAEEDVPYIPPELAELRAASSQPAPSPEADDGEVRDLISGHYGTLIRYPSEYQAFRSAFGEEGDQTVYLNHKLPGGKVHDYAIRICSKKARPGYSSHSVVRDIRAEAARRGIPKRRVRAKPVGTNGWSVAIVGRKPVYHRVVENDEFVYAARGPNAVRVRNLLEMIEQIPRERHVRQMVEAGVFVPDASPPAYYRSGQGFQLPVPSGYTVHAEAAGGGEKVFIFPLKHGIYVTKEILQDPDEYVHFRVTRVEAVKYALLNKTPRRALAEAKGYHIEKYDLSEEHFESGTTDQGYPYLDRREPSFLRVVAWEEKGIVFMVSGGHPDLMDRLISELR